MSLNLVDVEWHEFFIEDTAKIFSGRDIYDAERVQGKVPYISSTAKNNGIGHFVGNRNSTLESNCLSVNRNGSVGYSFFHPYKGLYSNDCRKLRPIVSSNYVAFFLANQISFQRHKYSYGYKMGTGRLKRQKIMLPAISENKPNWQFMEDYTKALMDKKKATYIELCLNELAKLKPKNIVKLEDKEWHEFFLKDIFKIVQRGKRLTKANQIQGGHPYISSTSLNNGVNDFIGNEDGVRMFSNCLTIANSGSVGASFYQPYKFVASDHVTHLQNDHFDRFIYLFIATLTNRLSDKYNFNREINDKRISRDKVMLPVKEDHRPDFEYMAQYMINLEYRKRKQYLYFLQSKKSDNFTIPTN
ncbi:restriction endonuclease subunit S [Psychrobacter sanguinis]|uniref:restriction endonuclease subunit S n=1 Tax=Psychrobacter sanguinis TaxID=861445 RepID=UPI001919A0B7|nr:restriction endonuclease subunit S [Psychrobacter sanguinis]MCC3307549.1 restriction endonuclease subunit S [Psychrobacter sanguinis]